MLNTEFTVDMAVWQDGVTFQSALASKPAEEFELPQTMRQSLFARELNDKTETTPDVSVQQQTARPAPVVGQQQIQPPVLLTAQEKAAPRGAVSSADVAEIPAALANAEDLTPFVVSADTVKPGSRLNEQLERTTFSQKSNKLIGAQSPYNMSEETAKSRETARNTRTLKGPGDAKVFPMDTAARYRNNQTKFGVAQPLTANAPDQAKQLRIEEMRQQAKAKTINEINTSLAQKPAASKPPVDIEAIRSQVSTEGFGYKRDNLPLASSEQVSPAASWFPEAMTRQLDAYEAAHKVAAQYGAAVQKNGTDLNV